MGIIRITKSSVLLLLPCLASSLFFLLYWVPQGEPPCPRGVLYKCLPIVFLCLYVGRQILREGLNRYTACILLGLLFSGAGDAYLVYQKDYFIEGMLAFAVAHLFYSIAFHEQPMWWKFMAYYMPFYLGMFAILSPRVSYKVFWPGVLYGQLISVMLWRAAARLDSRNPSGSKLCAFLGAFLFLVSDTVLSLNKFAMPLPYAQYLIMTTYYTSQILIALSVQKDVEKAEENSVCANGLKKDN